MECRVAESRPLVLDEAFFEDPYPAYQSLRRAAAVQRMDLFNGAWVLARHAEVSRALLDPNLSARRSDSLLEQFPEPERRRFADFKRLFAQWMIFFEPGQHHACRKGLLPYFSRSAVEGLRGCVQQCVDELLDAVGPRGRMDAIADFAHPLPAMVIAAQLGVPRADLGRIIHWTDGIAAFFGCPAANPVLAREAQRSLVELTDYFRSIAGRRRPETDLMAALAQLAGDGLLSSEELHAQGAMLLFAGHETTRNMIGNGLAALFRHPRQMRRLQSDPGLAGTAIGEFLRYDSPVQIGSRVASRATTLGGRSIAPGDLIILLFGSANRDPDEFPDPDRLDVARSPNRHVSFGLGPYMCLGKHLTLLEGEIAFNSLLERFPDVSPEPGPLEWARNFGFRGLRRLPVRLSRRQGKARA